MRKSITYGLLLFLLLQLAVHHTVAQTKQKDFASIDKKAEKLYKEKDFLAAKDAYSNLLSNFPKNPFYSYRFGVCLLYGDRRHLDQPVKYLEFASKQQGLDPEVFYYLGMAYHFNFRFADAIRSYEKYKSLVRNSKVEELDVDRQIEMCRNGMFLLSRVKDLYVLEKKEVKRSDFHRSYSLKGLGGEFLLEPPSFKSKTDKRKGVSGLVFFPKKQDVVLFSSYGSDDNNGKDIYRSYLLPDQSWSTPERLPGSVNTRYDEDYPYLMPDGKTLYFSSKGHNSMGGYDIFRSLLDTVTGLWGEPENLDFAINTPFDDILFVPDSRQNVAYFASTRSTVEDNIMVYKVRIDKRPEKVSELKLEPPVAREGKEAELFQRTLELVRQMADLSVNTTADPSLETPPAEVAVTEPAKKEGPEQTNVTGNETYSETVRNKIREKKESQLMVDSVFNLVSKMESSLVQLEKVNTGVNTTISITTDKKERNLAVSLVKGIEKETNRKKRNLEQSRVMAGSIQQMAATGNTESAEKLFRTLKKKILPGDTLQDYVTFIYRVANRDKDIPFTQKKEEGSFQADIPKVTNRENSQLLAHVLEIPDTVKPATAETVKPPTVEVAQTEKKEEPLKTEPVKARPVTVPSNIPMNPRKTEQANKILNAILVQKDSLKTLLVRTQRQKLLLMSNALDKGNYAGVKLSEANRLKDVLESVITEGSARDLKRSIGEQQANATVAAENAVLSYCMAARLTEREQALKKALNEIENQSVIIGRMIDSGKVEKAAVYTEVLLKPIREFEHLTYTNDDVVTAVHRNVRELRVNLYTYDKIARNLAVTSKSMIEMANNLRIQAGQTTDKGSADELIRQADELDKSAAAKQKESLDVFNQAMIWHNRSNALEKSIVFSKNLLDSIELAVKDGNYKAPRKRIKDTTLLVPVIIDLLTNNLPYNDSTYEFLASYPPLKNKPLQSKNEEILIRTGTAATLDDSLLVAQQRRLQEKPDLLTFQKVDPKVLELREKLALLTDSLEKVRMTPAPREQVIVSQWKEDQATYQLLKAQVDTLYDRLSRQPQLPVPSVMKGLLDQLVDISDSLQKSYQEYKVARLATANDFERESITRSVELEGLEVRATVNKLRFIINRLNINELSQGKDVDDILLKSRSTETGPESLFVQASEFRQKASNTQDEKRKTRLMNQAQELEDKALSGQSELAELVRNAPVMPVESVEKKDSAENNPEEVPLVTENIPVKDNKEVENDNETQKAQVTGQLLNQPQKEAGKVVQVEKNPVQPQETKTLAEAQKKKPIQVEGKKAVVKVEKKPLQPQENVNNQNDRKSIEQLPGTILNKTVRELSLTDLSLVEKNLRASIRASVVPVLPGLYYSVQVGVYRQPRVSSQLFNISPLFEDVTQTGLYRYCSGIFGDRAEAVVYKNQVVQRGIPDAFVVVFYRGKRIGQAEVKTLTAESITQAIPAVELDKIITEEKSNIRPKVYFSIQLAAFKRAMTEAEMKAYQDKISAPASLFITETGMYVLVTGEYNDYESSLAARIKIVGQGITDAFIVGFIDGKRVMAYQAREAMKTVR
ncbi:MAG: hypothetical protein NTU44_01540 [Bacteroidetes bacterium]|nr:hypothetical protein [Bacteroidota bacterium]